MTRGETKILDGSVSGANFAEEDDSDHKQLSHLDVLLSDSQFGIKPLKGLKIIVVGAGPAGLIFARSVAEQGAEVIVLEKAGDPRGEHAGYTDRSFNITIENVGRYLLADKRAWKGGIWLEGRAIQNYLGTNETCYTSYGDNRESQLISISRPLLRQNMVNLALEKGATICFHTRVTDIDAEQGVVSFTDSNGSNDMVQADLVIICDGLHSLGNDILPTGQTVIKPDQRSYVIGLLYASDNHNLSLKHIHFWHEKNKEPYTIGIPMGDGSIGLLLNSAFADFAENEHPFKTPDQARTLLKRDFAQLYDIAGPQLAQQLPHRSKGRFKVKAVERYVVGKKGVLVGDAGCAFPPWAGFGANSAMYGAASLAYLLAAHRNIAEAMRIYEAQQLILQQQMVKFVLDHGEFFVGEIAKNPKARSDQKALGPLIKIAQIEAALDRSSSDKQFANISERLVSAEGVA